MKQKSTKFKVGRHFTCAKFPTPEKWTAVAIITTIENFIAQLENMYYEFEMTNTNGKMKANRFYLYRFNSTSIDENSFA